MDNLARDMMLCEKAGFGVHYGRWKATQPNRVKPKEAEADLYTRKCAYCGHDFYFHRPNHIYCTMECAKRMRYERKLARELEAEKARND